MKKEILKIKLSFVHYFVFFCLFLGFFGVSYYHDFFTAKTLAETVLIIASLTYLASKYFSSKIISKYQDYHYQPNKTKKIIDYIIVESSFHILIPLSLDFLVISCFLFILKILPISIFGIISNLVNPILDFNSQYIKYPITVLIIILSILTITRYLTITKFKSLKKVSKFITTPGKLLFILTFFLCLDKGIGNKDLEYKFNSMPVVSEELTFNSNTASVSNKQEKIKNAIQDCINYVVERLNNEYIPTHNYDSSHIYIFPNPNHLTKLINTYPEIKNKVSENIRKNTNYFSEDRRLTVENYSEALWKSSAGEKKTSNLYEEAVNKSESFFDDFISTIADKRKDIKVKKLSEDADIIKKLMSDFFGEILPFDKFSEHLPFHKILNDKAVDLLKEKIVNSIYSLFRKNKIEKKDFSDFDNYIDDVLSEDFKVAVKSMKKKTDIFSSLYCDIKKEAANNYFTKRKINTNPEIITYVEGLIKNKEYLQKNLEVYENTLMKRKESILKKARKDYPGIPDEELLQAINEMESIEKLKNVIKHDEFRISDINSALSQKEKLSDYYFIRDKFSAGGIFFGLPISIINQNKINPCNEVFVPELKGCPESLLKDQIISTEVVNDFIIIHTINNTYYSKEKIDKDLFLSAYNYVYSDNSYPVLIDGFYDEKFNKIFSYNANIIHDSILIKILFSADQFIFDLLGEDKKLTSQPQLSQKFKDAFTEYKNSRSDVSMSRIYDESHYITIVDKEYFVVNNKLKFSVVSRDYLNKYENKKYFEMENISRYFNENIVWLLNVYSDLQLLNKFASYQALFRSVPQKNSDISELIVQN